MKIYHTARMGYGEADITPEKPVELSNKLRDIFHHMSHTYAAWGIGENTIGVNRRNDPDSMDPRLGILSLADPETLKPKVLIIRVTAHANILTGDNFFISPDYFGITRARLEKKYGCRAVLIQGGGSRRCKAEISSG